LQIGDYTQLVAYLMERGIPAGDSFLWVREPFYDSDPSLWEDSLLVHGHTPVLKLARLLGPERAGEYHFVDGDLCFRTEKTSGRVVSVDVDSGSVMSGRMTAAGFMEERDENGRLVVRMRSLTVSREDIFPRDLGIIN